VRTSPTVNSRSTAWAPTAYSADSNNGLHEMKATASATSPPTTSHMPTLPRSSTAPDTTACTMSTAAIT
jgi:hypothetical protein